MKSTENAPDSRPRRGRRPAGATPGREALIKTANLYFMRHGYGASLRDISATAGVNMALAARLFGSKEKFWKAVVAWHETVLERHLRAVDELERRNLPPDDALRRLLALHAAHCITFPEFFVFFMHEAVNPGPRLDRVVERLILPLHRRYLPFMERAREAGVIQAADSDLTLTILITGISLPMIAPVLCGKMRSRTRLARKLIDEATRLLLR